MLIGQSAQALVKDENSTDMKAELGSTGMNKILQVNRVEKVIILGGNVTRKLKKMAINSYLVIEQIRKKMF